MSLVRVGDIAEQVRGVTYGKSDATTERVAGTLPLFRANNVQDGSLEFDDLIYVDTTCVAEKQILRRGDIVVVTSSGSLSSVGKAAQFDGKSKVTFGAFCKVVRPSNKVEPSYLGHFFRTQDYRRKISSLASGANINNLKNEHIDNLEIPLPPLDEQRRIAAILDQADALLRKRREAISKSEALLSALFEATFGNPHEATPHWPTIPFGELLSDIESGWSPTCLDRPALPDEWGVLKLGAVTYGRFDETAQKALPEGVVPRPGIEVRRGDLLFTRKNTYDLVAACALVRDTRPRLLLPDLIFRLCLTDSVRSHPEYIHALLSHPTKRAEVQSLASGAAGSMPNISKARLRTVPIKLPPPDLQARFAEGVKQIEQVRSRSIEHLTQLATLFASLQHCAFRGEL